MQNNSSPENTLNYEAAIAELESIVQQMESDNLPLAQSLTAYKRGAELLKICQQSLSAAEQQISIISEENKLTAFNADET